MRFHLKNFSVMCLSAFVSVILMTAVSTFGQEPARPHDNLPPHQKQAAHPNNPVHRPLVQAAAIADQLKQLAERQKPRWEELLRVLKLAANLLSGNETNLLSGNNPDLLSKNKAALLSGNSPTLLSGNSPALLSGNSPKLLSGNKPNILSGNQTPILSGNRFSLSILSNLKIEIHIENTGNNSGNQAPPPPNAEPMKRVIIQQQGNR